MESADMVIHDCSTGINHRRNSSTRRRLATLGSQLRRLQLVAGTPFLGCLVPRQSCTHIGLTSSADKSATRVGVGAAETPRVPFVPEPILPGGVVLPLFEPNSELLVEARLHEPESYNHRDPKASPSDPVRTVVGVHNPSLEAHILPPGPQNSGSCVIVVPGGGHSVLVIGSEGADCVPFFASRGISTVILRERLRIDGYNMVTDAMNDTFQAIRLVRANATTWGLDPAKIGIMGFSAGAELAAGAAIEYDEWNAAHADTLGPAGEHLHQISCRPDFVGLLYPGPTPFQNKESRELTGCTRLQGAGWADDPSSEPDPVRPQIPDDVPPSFIATPSSGDRIHAIWAAEYYCAFSTTLQLVPA
eukprot:COSAG02_NODE_5013_length_4724_cov_2.494486_2_plen_361_part_00